MTVTTAATSVRGVVKTALCAALREKNQLAGVPVDPGWPGRNLQREHVWVARISGEVTYPVMMAGRMQRDDRFTVTVIFQAGNPGTTPEQADDRALEMFSALEDVLADDQTLDSLAGLIAVTLGATVEGPDAELTDEGAVSFIRADIEVHTRLS